MEFFADSLNGGGFSWRAALSLASASKLAYRDSDAVRQVVEEDWGLNMSTFVQAGGTQGFVAQSHSAVLVAFRGTEELADWLANMNISAETVPYGKVHRGFHDAYMLVAEAVKPLVLEAANQSKSLVFTGHSLGGALAMLLAMDLPDHVDVAGLYTFGQPKTASNKASEAISARHGHAYHRFVNDQDVVARIPPNFTHAGTLFHFDYSGTLIEVSGEFEDAATGVDDFTEDEFAKLQRQIKQTEAAVLSEVGETEGILGDALGGLVLGAIEALVPGVRDHRLDDYITHIRRYAQSGDSEAQAEFESMMDLRSDVAVELPGLEDHSVLAQAPFVVWLNSQDWDPPENVTVHSRLGDFATITAPQSAFEALRNDRNIRSIEGSRDAGIEELDQSVPFVKADQVHRPEIDEKGDSAIVCIIDTGIDILHEAFRDTDGNSRIIGIWDQRDSTGPSPKEVDSDAFSQDFGTLHTGDAINQHLRAFIQSGTMPGGRLRDPYSSGHGTHVASIAAGAGSGTLPDGMAPEAKILCVVPNSSYEAGAPPSLGYSVSHIDALSFAKSVSAGGNVLLTHHLPIIINVSLGKNAGAHDGKTAFEVAFDAATGGGREPGCVIVKSAGNERGHAGHASAISSVGQTQFSWESSKRARMEDYFEVWSDGDDLFAYELVDPKGNRYGPVSKQNRMVSGSHEGNSCNLALEVGHRDNGDNRLTISIRTVTSPIQPDKWRLVVTPRSIRSTHAEVHIWVERNNARAVRFDVEDPNMTLSIPGTANTVITVGACNSKLPPMLNASSSYGPTRDKVQKPELCAPGHAIIAARANQADTRATRASTGTSMAAPHVAGALALVMSHRHKQSGLPQYAANTLKQALKNTLQNFSHVHSPGFGHGVLDAEALFNELK